MIAPFKVLPRVLGLWITTNPLTPSRGQRVMLAVGACIQLYSQSAMEPQQGRDL